MEKSERIREFSVDLCDILDRMLREESLPCQAVDVINLKVANLIIDLEASSGNVPRS